MTADHSTGNGTVTAEHSPGNGTMTCGTYAINYESEDQGTLMHPIGFELMICCRTTCRIQESRNHSDSPLLLER